MSDEFDGFPEEGLRFLQRLGTENKAWFDANRPTYESAVVAPTKAFVSAMGERLAESFAPAITAQPKTNGSIAPINNDLRFSPEKSPYKDHLLLKFWEGEDKKIAPTLHIRLSADDVGFATGAMFPDVERWRDLVADDRTGEELATALASLSGKRGPDLHVAGEGYKRVPKPFDEDHPRADLLKHKWLQARWSEPLPESARSAAFVDHCAARLEECAPVHRWLVTHL